MQSNWPTLWPRRTQRTGVPATVQNGWSRGEKHLLISANNLATVLRLTDLIRFSDKITANRSSQNGKGG